jgi:ferredoxin
MGTDHEHRVCTFAEAEKAIREHDEIYVMDCFCRRPAREGKTSWAFCGHSIETCMSFRQPKPEDPSYEFKEVTRERALELYDSWKEEGGFFRFVEDQNWICFCCGCGCEWFRDKDGSLRQDPCDKSPCIEKTDHDLCMGCGECVDVCAYQARSLEEDIMVVQSGQCYGCSACEYVCPEDAIVMVQREAGASAG